MVLMAVPLVILYEIGIPIAKTTNPAPPRKRTLRSVRTRPSRRKSVTSHPSLPMSPGLVESQEHGYLRHGTRCLHANLEVAIGRPIAPSIGKIRANDDLPLTSPGR